MSAYYADISKPDTEGFDAQVLGGAQVALASCQIDLIVTEVSFHKRDTQHSRFLDVYALLEKYDYDLYGIYYQCHEHGDWNMPTRYLSVHNCARPVQ